MVHLPKTLFYMCFVLSCRFRLRNPQSKLYGGAGAGDGTSSYAQLRRLWPSGGGLNSSMLCGPAWPKTVREHRCDIIGHHFQSCHIMYHSSNCTVFAFAEHIFVRSCLYGCAVVKVIGFLTSLSCTNFVRGINCEDTLCSCTGRLFTRSSSSQREGFSSSSP